MITTLQRYFFKKICSAIAFVACVFLALFAFFDLISELPLLGRGHYQIQHALLYVTLRIPGYLYELMPIAALIGSIFVLAQMAASSEFTIMRVSGLSTRRAILLLAPIGTMLVFLTYVFGELLAPTSSLLAERLRLQAQGSDLTQEFRSGFWAKDNLQKNTLRFLNAKEITPQGELTGVQIYEFDTHLYLQRFLKAESASYAEGTEDGADKSADAVKAVDANHQIPQASYWRLKNVEQMIFVRPADPASANLTGAATDDSSQNAINNAADLRQLNAQINTQIHTTHLAELHVATHLTPNLLLVQVADPNRMSALRLANYIQHLTENQQSSERYQIAFWKKIIYPFAVLVMMALALPFAYLHFRSGGTSFKSFCGIMLGVSFHLMNNLFSHLGLLNTWPPFFTALLPSLLFLFLAAGALWWVERH